jgi:peptidoglycan hydrolase-like protein with peptidoglycan-binding domain
MEKILTKELLEQIRLMSYDRSMTLSEQTIPSDRLGKTGSFNQTPKIENTFNQERLDKQWKGRLCRSRQEDLCKDFGGTKIFQVKGSSTEELVLGQGYTCGCKVNGEILINGKTQRVNDYLMNIFTKSTYEIQKFLQDPHNILMIGSIVFTFGGAPVLGFISDMLDSAQYLDEGNYFDAGLAFLFSVIPFQKITESIPGVKGSVKEIFKKIYKKIKSNIPLDEIEKKIIDFVTSKTSRLYAIKRLFKMKIKKIVKDYDVFYFVRFLYWMVNKSLLSAKFLTKWGLIIGGVFWSWYKIAEWMGIDEKSVSSKTIPSKVKDNVLSYLMAMKQKGYEYSTSIKGSNLPEIAAVQYLLFAGNFFNTQSPSFKIQFNHLKFDNSENIKSVKIIKSDGKMIEEFINKNYKNFITNKTLSPGLYSSIITYNDGIVEKVKFKVGGTSETHNLGRPKIKWGFFDSITENAVKKFQNNNGLTSDGVIDKITIQKMIDSIQSGKITNLEKVDGIAKYPFVDKKETKKLDTNKLDREELEEAYKSQVKQIEDSVYNNLQIELERLNSLGDSINLM